MPANANVIINYGPYEACGIVKHRTSRLEGLQAQLTSDGHKVTLKEIKDWNEVKLTVNGETIFTCDIKLLDYGGDGQLDKLCAQAVKAVQEAY